MNPLEDILRKIIESQRVFKSAKLVNDTLIVVLNDGQILSKKGATQEDYNAVINSKSTVEIKNQINNDDEEEDDVNKEYNLVTIGEMKKAINKRVGKFK
jgi:predicted house-cleaning noncanonical NTP pyrophosphatase (MazG superfamily)